MAKDVDQEEAEAPSRAPEGTVYRDGPKEPELPPYPCNLCGTPQTETKLDRSPDVSRLSRHSYLAGLAGMLAVIGGGYLAARRGMLDHGWGIESGEHDVHRSMALVLLVCSAVMFLVELAIRLDVDRGRIIKLDPDLKEGRTGRFLLLCLLVYGVEVGLLTLIIGVAGHGFGFYRTAGEYGFHANGQGYYKPWFTVMDTFWKIYVFGGLPYVLLTRALQHSPKSDRRQGAFTVIKGLRWLLDRLSPTLLENLGALVPGGLGPKRPFDKYDRYAFLGLCVKGFYVPLMTVFFVDQFTHLVKNFAWMTGPSFSLSAITLRDVHNVSHSFIFAVDVGLAWCGYVVSSRWIKNTIFSAEPTFVGWFVALACYPPHNRLLGVYFGTPGEDAFFAIPNPRVVTFFAILSILSFCVYTSATVVFGLRFSNLTHRGVITTGPYAYIRHPAYASKNFSWWCVMLPFVLWQIYNNSQHDPEHTWDPVLQILGMFLMSFVYYWRAITEERHLSRDPEYRKYMQKVPYRFIPGVL
jgi:protein-S-isoprenylcysteine O-methyltransferase Ste14